MVSVWNGDGDFVRGESLTTHRNPMKPKTQNYNYNVNHNLDIKSTQIAAAGRSLAKGSVELARIAGVAVCAAFGAYFLFYFLCAALVGGGMLANHITEDRAARSKEVKYLDFPSIQSDYNRNQHRADELWLNRYVAFTGKVSIYDSHLDVLNGTYKVRCNLSASQIEQIKKFDQGDLVTVVGLNYERERSYGVGAHVTLRNCSID